MPAPEHARVRRLLGAAAAATVIASLLPAAASAGPRVAGPAAQPAAGLATAGLATAGPAAAPTAQPAADVQQPSVREIALAGVDPALLARAPEPQAHQEAGAVSTLGVGSDLQPALAAGVQLSSQQAAALVAVVADEPFPADSVVQVRVKDQSGWSEWTELHVDPEHGPDPGSEEARDARVGSDPLLAVEARKVRVRIDTPSGDLPAGTRLSVVNAPAAASDARTPMSQMATVGRPPIVTRAQWGADESWRRRAPYYTDNVRAGFVHHTASTSNYSPAQAAAQVRAIYAYHTKSLRHSDIDYNFVVDRFGRLYEGRYGGMDRPVLGGHTAGFNEHTFAVVALGNFDSYSPPASDLARIKDSIARLFAWKLGLHGVSPGATVELVSAGFPRPIRYPGGTVARISATSSHQTVNYTACPGRYLQRELADIRALADRYSDVVLTAPSPTGRTVTAGASRPVTFSSFADRAVRWRADVLSPCSDTPIRTFTGSTSRAGALSVTWDLRDRSGAPALPATYSVRLTGTAQDGTPVASVTGDLTIEPAPGGAWGPCANASRLVGSGPSTTSVLWGRVHAPGSRVVVLTGSEDDLTARAAGLVAAPLARVLAAPLLMTPPSVLAEEVAADIRARAATEVLIVGGPQVVSESVARAVAGLGARITRLGGSTPAATAAEVADRMPASTRAVLVTPDGSPAHAHAGAALAAARGVPLLLATGGSVPAETRAALTGRSSVTVAASSALSDSTLRAALSGLAWNRLAGADVVGASVAVAEGFAPGAAQAVLVPEATASWSNVPIAAATGAPVIFTASPVLSPAVADHLRSAAFRGAVTPVSSAWLTDEVLGAASRVLTGKPWAPPTSGQAPAPTSTRKVGRANAKPEPVALGAPVRVAATVREQYTDGSWRRVPAGVPFVVQFRPAGTRGYVPVGSGVTQARGRAILTAPATVSGRWRVVVGTVASASDYVRVGPASPTSTRKVGRANAKPEPVALGAPVRVAATVREQYTDGSWRRVPAGVPFVVQFRRAGATEFRRVGSGTTLENGRAVLSVPATGSGRWRVAVGAALSRGDYVKAR